MRNLERRALLRATGALAALAVPLGLVLNRSARANKPASSAAASGHPRETAAPRVALVPDKNGLCDLPPGFRYTVLERSSGTLSDGFRVPGNPDGMGCFDGGDGTLVLLRNHELDRVLPLGPFAEKPPPEAYDPRGAGGVTRLVVNAKTLERVSSNLVLAGTIRNCAGGVSPWGWLSCEETTVQGHGYVFLCPASAKRVSKPQKIQGYGRFNHEAVCIDPETHVAYLTEDRADGCLYRFVPTQRERPFEGRLEALAIRGEPRFDTGSRARERQHYAVEWVPIDNPDPRDDSVRLQGHARGAALFRRGEGIWFHAGAAYFTATSGGARGTGQIFRLVVGRGGTPDRLELVIESKDSGEFDAPDNITLAPWGDVYIAEDGPGEQFVRGITPAGRVFDVARNAHSNGEFAGLCFSPDGSVLFLNLYREGATLAVRGPFRQLGV